MKKHEAISADILARSDRFSDLKGMSGQLETERYWRAKEIKQRCTVHTIIMQCHIIHIS